MFYLDLPGGTKIPVLGYGTWEASSEEIEAVMERALEAGYRHIDTATVYGNEKAIGNVIQRWITAGKLKREELFIVTKLPPAGNRPESVPKFIKQSLRDLQVDYIDLYLIHVPFAFKDVEGDLFPMKDGKMIIDATTDHVATWKALEDQVKAGHTKAIGVSNFNIKQLKRIIKNATIPIATNQIELHAYWQQTELAEFCKKNNIIITAYSPLGNPSMGKFLEKYGKKVELPVLLNDSVVKTVAQKHNKTPAQVLLRHLIQKGYIVIPKSTNPERIRQNFQVFDFELDSDDMAEINGLDRGIEGRLVDFTVFEGVLEHPEYPFPELVN